MWSHVNLKCVSNIILDDDIAQNIAWSTFTREIKLKTDFFSSTIR